MTLEQFREQAAQWLEMNCPQSLRGSQEVIWGGRKARYPHADTKLWLDRMAQRGWTVPSWPNTYGGAALDSDQAAILQQEMTRLGCPPPLFDFGISLLGPVLLEFGTDAQKACFLPAIARGEIRWCQGFSEPEAGSDLASLQCRAARDGDRYRVTGHKIWTSYGAQADWIFCLVRTHPGAPKHEGISLLLIDMESEGVSTVPMELINGASRFCQVFLDEVFVPIENRLGEEQQGWTIAKKLLAVERAAISQAGDNSILSEGGLCALADVLRRYHRENDRLLRDEVAQAEMDDLAFRAARTQAGEGSLDAVARASFLKYYGTELTKRRTELRTRIMGVQGLGWEGGTFLDDERDTVRQWLWTLGYSILGGTSEIQLNVIARRGLNLPG